MKPVIPNFEFTWRIQSVGETETDLQYQIADAYKYTCQDPTSTARTIANVIHYLNSPGPVFQEAPQMNFDTSQQVQTRQPRRESARQQAKPTQPRRGSHSNTQNEKADGKVEKFGGFEAAAEPAAAEPAAAITKTVNMKDVEGFKTSDIGKDCVVTGLGSGVIRFVGFHGEHTSEPRIGIEMSKPKGKNNGTVNNFKYFECTDGHGLLTIPAKVQLLNNMDL
jgi:hypothetical protein